MRKRPVPDRFWEKVNKSGPIHPLHGQCWAWTATTVGGGYGHFTLAHGIKRLAHRTSWYLTTGQWPSLDVCHHCDNPLCVNPAHLFLGDAAANMADRDAKGRGANHAGTANGRAKLTEESVVAIRARAARGESARAMAREFGVSGVAVALAVRRQTWRHVA